MDPRTLRTTFGRFATGVTVVTCSTPDGTPHGATVTAFTPISLDPPLVQVALTRSSKACTLLDGADFAVNVLSADQSDVAMHFAGRPRPEPIPWRRAATAPVLDGTAATICCRAWRADDGGDHVLFLGEIVEVTSTDKAPLLFHDSAFREIGGRPTDAVWLGSADDPHSGWFDATTCFAPFVRSPLDVLPADSHF